MTTVQKLPQDVQNLLRSGVVISDITRCVSELVENALDAGCTSVAVRLNFNTFNLQVIDNGRGLTKDQLDLIGTRYMTSKCSSLKDLKKGLSSYGYRGEALASIKESCAILTIVSKANGSLETCCKVFRNNAEPMKAEVAAHDRVCIGTTVIVKDFLCGQPVRRARIRPVIELEQIRLYLVAQAIVNHKVAFTLRNDVSKTMILKSVPCEDLITAFSRLCKTEASKQLINIVASNNCFNISGCISRETESSNQFQFLYINQHFLRKTKIHKVINVFLQNSFYLRDIAKQKVKKVHKNQSGGSVDSSPVTSSKFAVFVINIKCPPNEYEIFFEPKRTLVEVKKWESLLECIKRAVDIFLETEIDLKVKKSAEKYPLKLINESMNENNNSYNIKENSSIIIGLKVKRAEENKNAASIVNSPILTDINKTNNTSQNTLDIIDTIKDCTTLIPQNLSSESYPLNLIEKNMNENLSNSNNIEENSNFIFGLKANKGEKNKINAPILNSPIVTDINIANNTNENMLLDTIKDCTTLKPQKLSTNSSEKYESENPLTKSCRSQTLLRKKRGLSEHVTTESEMDPTPVKKLPIFDSSSLVIVNKNVSLQIKRTTLPIVSQDLFESNRNEIMSNWKTLLKVNSNPKMENTENSSQVRIFRNVKTVQTKRYPKKINQDRLFTKEIHFRTNQKSICNKFTTDKMNKSLQPINVKRSLFEINFKKRTLKTCKEINNNIVKNLSHDLIVNKPSKNQNMSWKQKFSSVKLNPVWNFHKNNNFNNVNFKIPLVPNQIFDHTKSLKKEFYSKVNLQPGPSDISTIKYSLKKSCISNFNNECVISEPCYENGFKSLNSGYCKSKTEFDYNDTFFAQKRKCNEQSFPIRECQPRCSNFKKDIISKDDYIIEKLNSDDALYLHEMGRSKKDEFFIEKGNLNLNRDIIKKNYSVIENDIKTNSDIVYLYESGSKTNQSSIGKGRLNTINYNTEVNIPSDRLSLNVIDNDNIISKLTNSNNLDKEILIANERNIHDINMKEDNLKNPENSILSENSNSMFNINTMNELNNRHILSTENLNMCNNSEQTRNCTSIKERTHNKEIVVDLENGMVIVDSVDKGLIDDELRYSEFKLQNTPKMNTKIEFKHNSENASAFVLLKQETTKHNEISLGSDKKNETINDKHLTTVIDSNDEQINLQSNISKLNNKIVENTTKEYLQHNLESSECNNFSTANKNVVQCDQHLCSEDPNQNSLILQSVDNISKNNSCSYWNKRTISNGKNIYIHSKTGMSSYLSPVHEFEDYAMSNRPWFVPKGCSPIMQALDNSCQGIEQLTSSAKNALLSVAKIDDTGDNLASVKWRNGDVEIEGNRDIISKLLKKGNVTEENWKHNHYGEVLRKPYVFNQGSLASAVVLGQVDSKFLTAILNDGSPSSLLVLFDQHAVDERIRLEKLSSDYKNIKGGLNSTCINPSLQITVTDSELVLVRNFLFHIQKLGLEISIEGPDLIITSVPTCLYNHALKEGNDKMRTILKDKVELLVKEQIQCLSKTRGVALSIPDTLHSIICYEACRGAIKFGDKLPKAMPQCLISELAKCELPFQCAHGRPVLTVLTELMPMHTEKWKPNLTNLKVRSYHRLKHLNLGNIKQNGFDTML